MMFVKNGARFAGVRAISPEMRRMGHPAKRVSRTRPREVDRSEAGL